MQIETAVRQVQNNTGAVAKSFQFELNAKTAQLLSDPYSNKPRAVLREYGCNAADSHQMAGKANVPFEVWLPSKLNPELIIKDYGIGLAPEGIADLFCKYGGSDKDKRNDVTGGLGFGSKAAWAVTDSFAVEARWNGKMHCFAMYKDEEGLPVFAEVGVVDTIEPNGLTIKIPVKSEFINAFHSEATKVFRRFNPLPKIMNVPDFKLPIIRYALKQAGWRIPRDSYDNETNEYATAMAIQGNVAYPIDTRALGSLTDEQEAVLELHTEIDFPMGDIQVPLSREAISYTQRTVAKIKDSLTTIGNQLPQLYQGEIDVCKTGYEASKKMYQITKPMGWKVKKLVTENLRWNGLKVPEYINASKSAFPTIIQYIIDSHELRRRVRVNFVSHTGQDLVFHPGHEILVRWDKKVKSIRPYIDHYWKPDCLRDGKALNIVVCEDDAHFEALMKAVGSPDDVLDVNNFPEPPKAQVVSTGGTVSRTPTAKVFVTKGNGFNETQLPGDHGGEYVALDRGDPQDIPSGVYFPSFLRAVQGWREKRCEVYGIPASHKNLPKRYPDKWISFTPAVLKEIQTFVGDKANAKLLSLLKFNHDLFERDGLVQTIRHALTTEPTLTATEFGVKKNSDFNKLVENTRPFVNWDKWESLISLISNLRSTDPTIEIKVLPGTIDLDEVMKNVRSSAPLLETIFVNRHSSFTGDYAVTVFKNVATYIAKM